MCRNQLDALKADRFENSKEAMVHIWMVLNIAQSHQSALLSFPEKSYFGTWFEKPLEAVKGVQIRAVKVFASFTRKNNR